MSTAAASRFLKESAFLRHYLWKYRRAVAAGLFALVIVDCLEVVPPLLLKRAVDSIVANDAHRMLLMLSLLYIGVSLAQGVFRYFWRYYLIRTSIFSGRDIRQKYTNHLFQLSSGFFDRHRVGDLMSLATNDVEAMRMAIGAGVIVFADALFYFLTFPVAMYILSPKLTLIAFLPLPFVPFIVMRNERLIHARFEKVQECFSRLAAMAQESLMGIRLIKAYSRENTSIKRFRNLGEEYIDLNLKLSRVQSAFEPTLDLTMSLGLVLLLLIGGKSVIAGAITLGTFVAFQRYIQKMIWPMAALGLAVTFYQRAVASSERMEKIWDQKPDVLPPPKPQLPEGVTVGAVPLEWKTAGRVEMKNLQFRYGADSAPWVLKNISLTIEPGERVAFVGSIGSGKSSLLSLLPRLYPVEKGMLFLDGIDICNWPLDELRRQVGYVSQDVFLFSESVFENVAFGLYRWADGQERTDTVHGAAEMAAVHQEVQSWKERYDTRLGERGVNLSGGQKQRLTIARAISKQPSVLVLDDALSSVDMATEEKILSGLRSRPGRNTELIAAHRISTIRDATRIVVLQKGEMIQTGTHTELIKQKNSLYWRFYEQQRLKEELEEYVQTVEQQIQPS